MHCLPRLQHAVHTLSSCSLTDLPSCNLTQLPSRSDTLTCMQLPTCRHALTNGSKSKESNNVFCKQDATVTWQVLQLGNPLRPDSGR